MFLKMALIYSGRWCVPQRNVAIYYTTPCDFPDDTTNINRWGNLNLTTNIGLLFFVFFLIFITSGSVLNKSWRSSTSV